MRKSIIVVFICLFFAGSAWGSFVDYNGTDRTGKKALFGAIGFTLSPDTFLFPPGIDFFLTNEFSIGPNIQLGVSDRILLLSAAANFKYHFDIPGDDFIRRLKPSIQGGLGVVMSNFDPPAGASNTDLGAIINFGFGFDIFLNDKFSLGNHMIFNITTPGIDDRFFFSWHFVTAKFFF